MVAGFEAYNQAGQVQASTELMNYSLMSKSTLTLDKDHYSDVVGHMTGGGSPLAFVYTSNTWGQFGTTFSDLVAIRSTTAAVGVYAVWIPTDDTSMPYWNIFSPTNGAQVTVYTFQKTSRIIPAEHGVGLEVYTGATGTYYPPPDYEAVEYPVMSFSSLHKPIRFVSSHNIGLPSTSEAFVSVGSTGTYAAIIRRPSITQLSSTGGATPVVTPGNIFYGYAGNIDPRPNARMLAIRMASNGFYYRGVDGINFTNGNRADGLVQLIDVAGY